MDHKRHSAVLWIAALIVVMFILPWTRNLLVFQSRLGFTPGSSFQALIPAESRLSSPADVGDALVIAERECRKAHSIIPFNKLIKKYPNEPALYASLLRYACLYGPLNRTSRPDLDPPVEGQKMLPWKPVKDSQALRLAERAIEQGERLDPDNAIFDLYEASLRFAQKRDAEALAAIHRAAGKRTYDDYSRVEVHARLRDSKRSMGPVLCWMNPLQRVSVAAAELFPHYADFRQTARFAMGYVRQDAKAGRTRGAMAFCSDIAKVGGLMVDNSDWAIGSLVGMAMQGVSVRGTYEALVKPLPDAQRSANDQVLPSRLLPALQAKAPDALSLSEWQSLERRLEESEALRSKIRLFFDDQNVTAHLYLLVASTALLSLGGSFMLLAFAFGVLWLIAYTWLSRRRRLDLKAGPGRLSIWLLSLLPVTIALAVVLAMGQNPASYLLGSNSSVDAGTLDALAVGLKLTMVLVVTAIALMGAFRAADEGRLSRFLARVRAGSLHAIRGLLILYLITMTVNIPLTAYINREVDRFVSSEMQMVHDWQPPAGMQMKIK